jgi:hypothetical protein
MLLRSLAVINRFSTYWFQSHVLYLCMQEVLGCTHNVLQSYSTSSLVLELSLTVQRPISQVLITVTDNEIPSIESLTVSDAEPYTSEIQITAAESIMIELQPTGSCGSTSRADSNGSKLVATSSSTEPDMMPVKLERIDQVVYAIRFSALGVDSGGDVPGCTCCAAARTTGVGGAIGVGIGGAEPPIEGIGTPNSDAKAPITGAESPWCITGGLCCYAQGAAITQPRITAAESPNSGDEVPIADAEAPCCITGGLCCGTQGAAIKQPRITAADTPSSSAEVPITDVEAPPCCIAGGLYCCAQDAANTQHHITSAGTLNSSAKAPITADEAPCCISGAETPNNDLQSGSPAPRQLRPLAVVNRFGCLLTSAQYVPCLPGRWL